MEKHTACSHYIWNPKNFNSLKQRIKQRLLGAEDEGNRGDVGQRVHIFRFSMSIFGVFNIQQGNDDKVTDTVLCISKLLRVNL